jgi:NADH pyrophosphatase NudC (nudix superfamily)
MAAGDPLPSSALSATGRDVRFCPYCGQMSFDVQGQRQGSVYCEFCGVDVSIAELVKTP